MSADDKHPRYYVQGETVRGEPRIYWVVDRLGKHYATEVTRDQRQAERWCKKMNAAFTTAERETP